MNFVLLSGGEAFSKIFSFLAFAHLARVFGPGIYGSVEFALAASLFFNLVVEGGLGLLGAREIAKNEQSVKQLTFHIVILRCALAVGSFLLLLVFVVLSQKTLPEKQLVVLYGLTLFWTPGLIQWVFQGLDWMKWVAVCSVVRWVSFAALVFLLISAPPQVWIVPLIEFGAIGLTVIINFAVYRRFFGGFWNRLDFSFALSLLRQAVPIALSQIMWGLKIYLPTIMLGLLIGGKDVGWFGAGYRIVLALHAFVWMYYFNIFPSISRCTQQATESLQKLTAKSLQVTSWAAIFIGAVGTLFAKPIISTIYGPQYNETAIGFRFLIWLIPFILISGHYMYILIAYNKQWLELLSATCGALASILLNLVLIPRFGFLGAVWTVLLAEIFVWILYYYFVRREIMRIRFWRHLTRPLAAGAVIVIVFFIVPTANFWTIGGLCTILYGIGVLVFQPKLFEDFRALLFGRR